MFEDKPLKGGCKVRSLFFCGISQIGLNAAVKHDKMKVIKKNIF